MIRYVYYFVIATSRKLTKTNYFPIQIFNSKMSTKLTPEFKKMHIELIDGYQVFHHKIMKNFMAVLYCRNGTIGGNIKTGLNFKFRTDARLIKAYLEKGINGVIKRAKELGYNNEITGYNVHISGDTLCIEWIPIGHIWKVKTIKKGSHKFRFYETIIIINPNDFSKCGSTLYSKMDSDLIKSKKHCYYNSVGHMAVLYCQDGCLGYGEDDKTGVINMFRTDTRLITLYNEKGSDATIKYAKELGYNFHISGKLAIEYIPKNYVWMVHTSSELVKFPELCEYIIKFEPHKISKYEWTYAY